MADQQIYREGFWIEQFAADGLRWMPAGMYDVSQTRVEWPEGSIFVPSEALLALVPKLEARGFIKPRLDDRLRAEDLKITHRLLDLLDKGIGA